MSTDTELIGLDLTDLRYFTDGPPYELFARLRADGPVHWNPLPDDVGFWSVLRYADIASVSQDSATFSSGARGVFIRDEQVLPWEIAQVGMINQDPPKHTQVRGIVQKVFTSHAIADQAVAIRRLANGLIDGIIETGSCDLVEDLAFTLPLRVIADMIGVPRADQPALLSAVDRIGELVGVDAETLRERRGEGLAAFGEVGEYVLQLVQERRQRPADDLLSRLIVAEVDGERLDDLALTGFVAFLMSAGSEEPRSTFSGGMLALAEHPDERAKLLENPELIPSAVEEALRYQSAIIQMRRTATRDVELAGVPIAEGDKVVMWYASGNRDERVFEEPDRFDVTRGTTRHQAFGGGGRHFCLGNQLARLELQILFGEVLRRMPDFEVAGPVVRKRSNFFHGLTKLPLAFTAGPTESG